MTGRTDEPLLHNLTHHIEMLTYFTNYNHLHTVLMIKATNICGNVSHVRVEVTTLYVYIYILNTSWVKIEFVKDRCCGGKWRVASLKSGKLEKMVKSPCFKPYFISL